MPSTVNENEVVPKTLVYNMFSAGRGQVFHCCCCDDFIMQPITYVSQLITHGNCYYSVVVVVVHVDVYRSSFDDCSIGFQCN